MAATPVDGMPHPNLPAASTEGLGKEWDYPKVQCFLEGVFGVWKNLRTGKTMIQPRFLPSSGGFPIGKQ